jgi:hypothetical protein
MRVFFARVLGERKLTVAGIKAIVAARVSHTVGAMKRGAMPGIHLLQRNEDWVQMHAELETALPITHVGVS